RPRVLAAERMPRMLFPRRVVPVTAFIALCGWTCSIQASPEMTERARKFLDDHTQRLRPLEVAASLAWWDANTTGKEEAFKRKVETQNKIDEALAKPETFAEVKALKENLKQIDDPTLARAVDVLYRTYLEKQVDTDL